MLSDHEKTILHTTVRRITYSFIGGPIVLLAFTLYDGKEILSIFTWGYLRGFFLISLTFAIIGLWALGPVVLVRIVYKLVSSLFMHRNPGDPSD